MLYQVFKKRWLVFICVFGVLGLGETKAQTSEQRSSSSAISNQDDLLKSFLEDENLLDWEEEDTTPTADQVVGTEEDVGVSLADWVGNGVDVFEEGAFDTLAKPDPSVRVMGPPPPLNPPVPRTIWQRIRFGFQMPELNDHRVASQVRFYAQYPKYIERTAERAGLYLYYIVEELEKRGMPTELALLPFVESSFNPEAVSSAKASGMWQFIPSTGKFFKLRQSAFHDERRDVISSTRAALDYLQKLYDQFQDWSLALASYNWGENAVARAQERNRREGKPTDYLSLNMPNETRFYVPRLLAVKELVLNPSLYGVQLPFVPNKPHFVAVYHKRDIDVDRAARLAGMSVAEFRALNPSFSRPVILAAANKPILLPDDKAEMFVQRLQQEKGSLSSWSAYTLNKRESISEIAKRYGMSTSELASINQVSPKSIVKAGSTLLVPRDHGDLQNISAQVVENAQVVMEQLKSFRQGGKGNKREVGFRLKSSVLKGKNALAVDRSGKKLPPFKDSARLSSRIYREQGQLKVVKSKAGQKNETTQKGRTQKSLELQTRNSGRAGQKSGIVEKKTVQKSSTKQVAKKEKTKTHSSGVAQKKVVQKETKR